MYFLQHLAIEYEIFDKIISDKQEYVITLYCSIKIRNRWQKNEAKISILKEGCRPPKISEANENLFLKTELR